MALSPHRPRVAGVRAAVASTAVALVASLGPLSTVPVHASGPTAITDWNRITAATLVAFPPPAGGAPPALQVNFAMVQGAVYDAVNAIVPRREPYLLEARFPGASLDAAIATAASDVLAAEIAGVPGSIAFPNRQTLLDSVATARDAALGRSRRRRPRPTASPPATPPRRRCSRRARATGGSDPRRGSRTARSVTGNRSSARTARRSSIPRHGSVASVPS